MGKESRLYIIVEAILLALIILLTIIFSIINQNSFRIMITGAILFFVVFVIIKILFIYLLYKNTSAVEDSEELVDRITETISGGYVKFQMDEQLTLLEYNKRFLKFTNYTEKEIKEAFHDKYLLMIDEPERAKVLDILQNQSLEQSKSQLHYKIICKGGEKKGVLNMFRAFEGKSVIQNFLIDPSAFKYLQIEKDIEAERYRIVAEQSESIIFDYNPADGSIFLNSYFKNKFGYEIKGNIFDAIVKNKIIHEDDIDKFMNLNVKEKNYNVTEIRIKRYDNTYLWCKVRITTLFGENNKPLRLIGKIIDVDKSRREKMQLIEKTKRDVMTGMYNKLATENLITDIIQKESDTIAGFLLFDIDNFKHINDEFGHIHGDKVLSEICEDLKQIFRSSDVLGRIGGDEFVVFIKDINNEKHAIKKAKDILEVFQNKYNKEKDGFYVSVSVGISFYNKDGCTYKELLAKADKALYKAKEKGKNTYEIYGDS